MDYKKIYESLINKRKLYPIQDDDQNHTVQESVDYLKIDKMSIYGKLNRMRIKKTQ